MDENSIKPADVSRTHFNFKQDFISLSKSPLLNT